MFRDESSIKLKDKNEASNKEATKGIDKNEIK